MPLRALRPAVRAVTSVAAATTLSLGTFVPAMADASPTPVAVDDSFTAEARSTEIGGVTLIDVLANDSAAGGEVLEICRVQAPQRGLSVAEVGTDGGFNIGTPNAGVGSSGLLGSDAEEGARERIVVLPWANRSGTYQFTYWACDTEHLSPATVTVTVTQTPEVTVRKVERPGRLRFTNPRTSRAVVIYGGLGQPRPDGRVHLAPGRRATRRVESRAIRWVAFSPRSGEPIGEGVVRGIRLPGASNRSGEVSAGAELGLTPRMLRAWRSS